MNRRFLVTIEHRDAGFAVLVTDAVTGRFLSSRLYDTAPEARRACAAAGGARRAKITDARGGA